MRAVARGFFTAAIAYGLLGMLLGLHMVIGHDHGQRPTHAHVMVIGWVSFAIFGCDLSCLRREPLSVVGPVHPLRFPAFRSLPPRPERTSTLGQSTAQSDCR